MVQSAKNDADNLLRVGVVGVGVMGSNHARVFADLPGVKLVGIADPDRKQRDFVADALGCRRFADVDGLLADGVDAVTIAAPTHLHRDLALACIERGVHVLVEKPIASSVEEGRAIIAAARRAGVALMVGHVERFNPTVEAIKEAIRDEDILSIAITRVGPFPPRMSNVGVVIDLAVHDIDLIRWFTDSEIVEVQPQLSSAVAEREDIALLQFRTASGVLAHINTNWLTPFKARNVTIATRNKYIMGDLLTRQVTECFGFQPDGSYSMRHLSVGHAEPLRAELQAFVGAIRDGSEPAVTGEEGVASLEIAIRCLREPKSGRARRAAARPAPADRLIRRPTIAIAMNQHARIDTAPIPFIDVAAQRRRLGRAIDEAIARVLGHCQFILGPEVHALEAELAAFCGARHAITCASGTDALLLVLMAKGIGPGDAVICPAFTFYATAEVVALVGATPVFVGRGGGRASISIPKSLAARDRDGAQGRASSRRRSSRSICSASRPTTTAIAADRGRRRSCSCSTTPRRPSARPTATAGSARSAQATATSFFPAKPLGCYGDGGAVFTDDDELAEILRSLRVHGEGRDKYDCVRIGIERPARHHPGGGADREAQDLPGRDRGARSASRARYSAALADVATVPARRRRLDLGLGAIHHPRRAGRRDGLRGRAQGAGHSDRDPLSEAAAPPERLPRISRSPRAALPVSERLADEVISLPMHAYLDEPTQDRIIAAVRRALGR